MVFLYCTGIQTLGLIDPLEVNEEKEFLFNTEQHGGKSRCHKTLIKGGAYTVRKEAVDAVDGRPTYWFKASVILPAPPGRCRRLVKKCFPPSTQNEIKLTLGYANCRGGEMEQIRGIA